MSAYMFFELQILSYSNRSFRWHFHWSRHKQKIYT